MSVFAPSGTAPLSTVSLQGSQVPTLVNISIPLANTEVSYTLPPTTKKFLIKLQGLAKLRLAYNSGTSGTSPLTIEQGVFYSESDLSLTAGLTLYFQASKASQIAEIISWA